MCEALWDLSVSVYRLWCLFGIMSVMSISRDPCGSTKILSFYADCGIVLLGKLTRQLRLADVSVFAAMVLTTTNLVINENVVVPWHCCNGTTKGELYTLFDSFSVNFLQ